MSNYCKLRQKKTKNKNIDIVYCHENKNLEDTYCIRENWDKSCRIKNCYEMNDTVKEENKPSFCIKNSECIWLKNKDNGKCVYKPEFKNLLDNLEDIYEKVNPDSIFKPTFLRFKRGLKTNKEGFTSEAWIYSSTPTDKSLSLDSIKNKYKSVVSKEDDKKKKIKNYSKNIVSKTNLSLGFKIAYCSLLGILIIYLLIKINVINVVATALQAVAGPADVPADVPAADPTDVPAAGPAADVPAAGPADVPADVPAAGPAADADAAGRVPADVPAAAPDGYNLRARRGITDEYRRWLANKVANIDGTRNQQLYDFIFGLPNNRINNVLRPNLSDNDKIQVFRDIFL